MVGGTVSLLLRLQLFQVASRLCCPVPMRVRTVINTRVCIDPDLGVGIALV